MPPTATDGVKNGDETDIDCGGPTAPPCANNKGCNIGTDCTSFVCSGGTCQAPSHTDGVKNGDETDIDCGGPTAARCAPGLACAAAGDCIEGVCTDAVCAAPSHDDGVKNGDETGTDCGGPTAAACPTGEGCAIASDCTSRVCTDDVCIAPTASDGVQNGDETDIDCGGSSGKKCVPDQRCIVPADCAEKVCTVDAETHVGTCAWPTFDDHEQNGTETDTDCGGSDGAPKCVVGKGCVNDQGARDCTSFVCENEKCQAPTFVDGVKNGNETGTDCGGPDNGAPKCPVGQGCAVGLRDCVSKVCGANNTCSAPSYNDNVENGEETDVDCGGPGAPKKCAAGKSCDAHTDCSSDGCHPTTHKCALAPSCARHFGGDTCGSGEVGQNGAQHESCCTSIEVPGQNVLLDKYEITAGRIREFFTRVPNVRQWVDEHNVPQLSSFNGYDLRRFITDGAGSAWHPRAHVGPGVFHSNEPSTSQGCWLGTQAQSGYGGHNTYWFSAQDQSALGGAQPRSFTQDQLDEKSITCVTYVLLAAFCAWDGGMLPTTAQTQAAWATYQPWGASPNYWSNNVKDAAFPVGDPRRVYTNWNSGLGNTTLAVYRFPTNNPGFAYGQVDQAFVVAAPGRMVNDKAAGGWMDLAANTFEIQASYTGATNKGTEGGQNYGTEPRVQWLGGSFEGHYGGRTDTGYQYPVMTKYGKTGGRCARPKP